MPRKYRCVFGCDTRGVIVHDFPQPSKFPEQFKAWVTLVGASLESLREEDIYRKKKMCHKHFTAKDLNRNNRLNVMIAIPSLHLTSSAENSGDDPDNTKAADITKVADITDSANRHDVAVIPDDDIHDGDTQEETEEQLFSWQRDSEVNCDDFEMNLENSTIVIDEDAAELNSVVIETEYDDTNTEYIEIHNLEEIRPETDNQSLNTREESDVHEGYKCDMCRGPIRRFRYSCVECANYDLCAACEARAAHPQHYLLRVPRPRPHGEIQLIMDTIRRFITADPKSLRAEANFVNTLMDELKSEVLSDAGSDPVPDEPDYPVESDDSTDEHEDCEMEESDDTHTPAIQDDNAQVVVPLDEECLEEWEFPQEIYKTREIIVSNDANAASDRDRSFHSRSYEQNVHLQNKPERSIVNEIDSPSSSNTLGKVSKRIFLTRPRRVSVSDVIHKRHLPGRILNKIDYPSPSNTSVRTGEIIRVTSGNVGEIIRVTSGNVGERIRVTSGTAGERISVTYPKIGSNSNDVPIHKPEQRIVTNIDALSPLKTLGRVSKKTLVTCPKSVSISDDVLKLLKTKDGDPMQRTINTIKHTLQSKVSVPLQRLSEEEIQSATKS